MMADDRFEQRLSTLDKNLGILTQKVTDRIEQDDKNFAQFDKNFTQLMTNVAGLEKKINEFLLREAEREGETKGIKKSIYIIAMSISLSISAIGILIDKIF